MGLYTKLDKEKDAKQNFIWNLVDSAVRVSLGFQRSDTFPVRGGFLGYLAVDLLLSGEVGRDSL